MEWAILRYRGSEHSKNKRKNRYFTRTYAGREQFKRAIKMTYMCAMNDELWHANGI